MSPEKINNIELEFAKNLTDSNGTIHTSIDTIDIGDGITINQIRPKYKSYYYNQNTEKKAICLHFTVGNIKGDIGSLTKENTHISVNYVVDRLGNIYNLFDDSVWSYHLGSGAIGTNCIMSKHTIGIEISNYGPLKLKNDCLIDAYGSVYCNVKDTEYYKECDYRGYNYYATMTDKQEKAVAKLLHYLCKEHNIPEVWKDNTDQLFMDGVIAKNFSGIYFHTSVRKDKFDWPMPMFQNVKDIFDGKKKKTITETKIKPEPKPELIEEQKPMVEETLKEIINDSNEIVKENLQMETKKLKNKSFFETIIDFIINLFKK